MKKICFVMLIMVVTACSPVDSLKPFDQYQVALMLNENRVTHSAQQGILVTLPAKQHWQKIDVSELNRGSPVILIPAGETENNWTQRISTQIIPYSITNKNLNQITKDQLQQINLQCKQVTLESQQRLASATMFEANVVGCKDNVDGTMVKKIFAGKDAFYIEIYTAKLGIAKVQVKVMTSVIKNSDLIARR